MSVCGEIEEKWQEMAGVDGREGVDSCQSR